MQTTQKLLDIVRDRRKTLKKEKEKQQKKTESQTATTNVF